VSKKSRSEFPRRNLKEETVDQQKRGVHGERGSKVSSALERNLRSEIREDTKAFRRQGGLDTDLGGSITSNPYETVKWVDIPGRRTCRAEARDGGRGVYVKKKVTSRVLRAGEEKRRIMIEDRRLCRITRFEPLSRGELGG